ncbi:protein ecdysoneless [Diorhabda sublineata]|uniref:protein ecdysoneless n=1 Tax=Diorhabda sublineata TaxID=1163346 RepID=UPI0024E0F785|nr:protein ecdysoneless [Diorhabda sublineata]
MAGVTNVLETVREDDFVEYFIFPHLECNDEQQQEKILTAILNKAKKIIDKYAKNYLWHKDEFQLSIRISTSNFLNEIEGQKENLPPHLYGVSHYGDNIEDEWFMVFLLQQLTKELNECIARVHDVDGEFLLIEAAEYLPNWANPETSQNRVYIYNGKIHLIPQDCSNTEIKVSEAIFAIRKDPSKTVACPEIQSSINTKLEGYPEKLKDNIHNAIVFIPIGVARVLRAKPNLISAAVQAFCNRDSIDLKACRAMKYFPPENRVKRSVVFTKCLYAMLTNSKYLPDRRTGWNLPSSTSNDYKSHLLGVKLACGFEILASQAKPSTDVDSDRGWQNYLKSLKDKGYFQEYLEHSLGYNNLLNKAKQYYMENRDSMHYSSSIGQDILDLSRNSDIGVDDQMNLVDDDDSWLNISSEELDKMLQEKYGQKKIFNVNNNSDASGFAGKLTSFLNHVSDVDGAEFPTENDSPVRPPRRKNKTKVSFSNESKKEETANPKINFDPNSFACALQNILNFAIPEDDSWDLESDSDMSEYEEDNYVKNQTYESGKDKNKLQKYMDEMDKELEGTTIGQSFEKKKNGDSFDDIETFKPVDINVNALKYILESYKSQMGEAGPSSNMLGPMGIHLDPKDNATVE